MAHVTSVVLITVSSCVCLTFLYLQGGGACWNQQTYDDRRCRRFSATSKRDGILDTDDQRSPFANYSVIVIHYCSSDYFLGAGTVSSMVDTTNETIYYHGIENTMAVLNYVVAQQSVGGYLSGKEIFHTYFIDFLPSFFDATVQL